MDTNETTTDNTDASIYVMEQPSLGEQALAAAVIAGATIAGSFVVYGVGIGLVALGSKIHDKIESRKTRKAEIANTTTES